MNNQMVDLKNAIMNISMPAITLKPLKEKTVSFSQMTPLYTSSKQAAFTPMIPSKSIKDQLEIR